MPSTPDESLVVLRRTSLLQRWQFGVLYFSEGAPIGFLWWAMPTLLRTEGVALERITALTAALVLPWTLKFLWAPLVDVLRGPRWGFRHWAGAAQVGMGLALLPLLFIDPAASFGWWFTLLLIHAVCAATQDVAIDALAVNAVDEHERGRLTAAMQIGMLTGRSVFGGGAILLAGYLGWPGVFGALVIAVWISLAVLWRMHEPAISRIRSGNTLSAFGTTLRAGFSRRTTWWGLGFALTAGAGFEAGGALAGPLLVDLGVPASSTGWFFAGPVVVAMAMGGWWGGRWVDRGPRVARVKIALGAVSLAVLCAGVAAAKGASSGGMMACLAGLYLGIGCFTAASYALFMDLTDPKLGATQFSTFMAATNACEAWAVWTAGRLVGGIEYGPTLMVMALLGLVGLWLLRPLQKFRKVSEAND
jgi:PAT family beta-lactamase induction signal transducer AmpG